MKTVLITNGNIMSLMSLKGWIDKYGDEILCLVITTKLPSSYSNTVEVFKMTFLSGFTYTFFKVFTNKLLPFYYKICNKHTGVASYLKHKDIDIIYADNVNDENIIKQIKSHNPEVVLSFSATTKFSENIVNLPSRVCINAHYALLPAYAGLSPYYWYLYNNEDVCGCTLHKISAQLDAGDIIESKCFSMNNITSVMNVLINQIELISPMLINFYDGKTSENRVKKQDLTRRKYYRHPLKEEVIRFHNNGKVFFDRKSLSILLKGVENNTR